MGGRHRGGVGGPPPGVVRHRGYLSPGASPSRRPGQSCGHPSGVDSVPPGGPPPGGVDHPGGGGSPPAVGRGSPLGGPRVGGPRPGSSLVNPRGVRPDPVGPPRPGGRPGLGVGLVHPGGSPSTSAACLGFPPGGFPTWPWPRSWPPGWPPGWGPAAGGAPPRAPVLGHPHGPVHHPVDRTSPDEFSAGRPRGVVLGGHPGGVVTRARPVRRGRPAAGVVRLAGVGFKAFWSGTLVVGAGYSHYVGVATPVGAHVRAARAGVAAPAGVIPGVLRVRRPDSYKGRGLYRDGQKPTTKAGKRR